MAPIRFSVWNVTRFYIPLLLQAFSQSLTYTVLTEWGIHCTEDIGEMMFNLTENHRVRKDENDTPECFANGYDFRETFLGPYQV